MSQLGIEKFDDLIGRTDLLKIVKDKISDELLSKKISTIDLSAILFKPEVKENSPMYCKEIQDHEIDNVMDIKLIEKSKEAIESKKIISFEETIKNTDRSVGAMLSSEISKKYKEEGLPEDTININFKGTAGQSFGAFTVKGITLKLEGEANDYLGKGLSGGKIIVVPPLGSTFPSEKNIIIGNVVLYGATSGEIYIRGIAGERFCIRNSGATAVVEGLGAHGCEYMTGGTVAVLGKVERNFAAGMSGGIAYVYDKDGNFDYYCNKELVELSNINEVEDIENLKKLISNHYKYTNSTLAKSFLDDFDKIYSKFVKVIPHEYKKILVESKRTN